MGVNIRNLRPHADLANSRERDVHLIAEGYESR